MDYDLRSIRIGFAFVVLFLAGIGGLLPVSQSPEAAATSRRQLRLRQ